MNTTSNRFKSGFGKYPILDGREYIEADMGFGVTVRAYVELDQFAEPNAWQLADYNADRLRFCELVLNVYIGDACIEKDAANLCGIGFMDGTDDCDYLTERANDLLGEIDIAGIVGGFAKQAAAAARKLKSKKA
jgi:hypothetical protein